MHDVTPCDERSFLGRPEKVHLHLERTGRELHVAFAHEPRPGHRRVEKRADHATVHDPADVEVTRFDRQLDQVLVAVETLRVEPQVENVVGVDISRNTLIAMADR